MIVLPYLEFYWFVLGLLFTDMRKYLRLNVIFKRDLGKFSFLLSLFNRYE